MGIDDINRILRMEDLVKGDDAIFAATGVTDGELLRGVQFKGSVGTTQSLVMRAKSGTVRFVDGRHSLNKNRTWLLNKSGSGSLRMGGEEVKPPTILADETRLIKSEDKFSCLRFLYLCFNVLIKTR